MSDYQQLVESNFAEFLRLIGYLKANPQPLDKLPEKIKRLNTAHGDKALQYEERWKAAGISFQYGLTLYLLSYLPPYSATVRYTNEGWVDPCQWVIDRFADFRDVFENIELRSEVFQLIETHTELVLSYIDNDMSVEEATRRARVEIDILIETKWPSKPH